jgi:glycosyltransferase involved in cell wall biosynthesis
LRILYFTRDYTPHDHRFLSALAATPHEIFSLRLERRGMQREDRPLPPQVTQVAWRGGARPLSVLDGVGLLPDLRRVLRELRPDVVHAGSIQTAALLTALSGFRPLVSMSWGSDLLKDAERNRRWRWATRHTLNHTTVLVGDCQAVADKAAAFGFPRQRVVLFPWGVDLGRFQPGAEPELRDRLGWPEDAFLLLSNRSWEPLYGVDVVVRAFIQAARQEPRLRLLLLGGGSQSAHLRQILIQSGLMERVHFGGQISNADLPRYYRAADLYLSASHSDGSSVSLMEALGCGRAVLVSDIAGNLEWITPGEQGWLFADGDAAALERGMLRAAGLDAARLAQMGRAARALAEARADWSKNFPKLLDAYRLALSLEGKNESGL